MITRSNYQKFFTAFLLATLLLFAGCTSQTVSRYEGAQKASTAKGVSAVVKESTTGGSFNKFFPSASGDFKRVYTQEKKGFAEAKLEKDGKEVAVMAISDTANNVSATQKFKQSSKTISGYPAVNQGSTGTAVLVGDRYQVKVLSRDPSFTESDRATWLSKFDLKGLSRLE
jgi:hypothetical protein